MTVGIVELLEVVEVENQNAEGLFGAGATAGLAVEDFGQVAAVIEAGQRILDRLRAQRLAQSNVGHGQADLAGKSSFEGKLAVGQRGSFIGGLKVQDAKSLALRQNRNAEI